MDIIELILASPSGISAGELERRVKLSRPTINRRLKEAMDLNTIHARGNGSARVYVSADPLNAIRQYFNVHHSSRQFAKYEESRLDFTAALTDFDDRRPSVNSYVLEKRDLVSFLVDFSCASSVLEGGTYSLLDTQALIEYGEKAEGKPLSDAFLVLNHKKAFEYLYENLFEYLYENLSYESIFEIHRRLTDDHDIPELANADHFLNRDQQGVREYAEVRIGTTSYSPPFRPGTGYIKKMLGRILDTASAIDDPIEASFYLFTRIPYLQVFEDGNKRTSRAMCNVPLLQAGMPPISFIDFNKQDYIISMLAFYELGDVSFGAKTFMDSYLKSCERLGVSFSGNSNAAKAEEPKHDGPTMLA